MPRTKQISKDDAHPYAQRLYELLFDDRDPVAEPGTATGTPGNWWTVTAAVPDMFDHISAGFQFYRDPARQIDPQLRELAQTRTGYARQSQFVYSQHMKAARSVGLSEEKVQAVRSWPAATCFSQTERLVLAYTDCLVLEGGRVPDELFAELQTVLSDEEILELTYITCTYDMHATMSRALRMEYDDVDDRIVEIRSPDGAMDAMGVVDEA